MLRRPLVTLAVSAVGFLPVATMVCAWSCLKHPAIADAGHSGHCEEPVTDVGTMGAVEPCSTHSAGEPLLALVQTNVGTLFGLIGELQPDLGSSLPQASLNSAIVIVHRSQSAPRPSVLRI